MTTVLEAILVLLIVIVLASIINGIEDTNKKASLFRFYDISSCSGLPIVTFSNNGQDFAFLLDTGSNYSIINSDSLSLMKHSIIEGAAGEVYGMNGDIIRVNYAHITLKNNNITFEDNFQVVNMSNAFNLLKENQGVEIVGIIGSNFMNKYHFVLDFEKLTASAKL